MEIACRSGESGRIARRTLCDKRPNGHHALLFTVDEMEGDLDNIVKPILDALERHIYMDDSQIHRIVVQKFELEDPFRLPSPSPTLYTALNKSESVLMFG
jgi:hypothetical protein